MKKVLMIAQHFPPAGGVGTFRVTKFVKYLRKFGWKPVVLTVREDCYPENVWLDRGLEKDIPQDVRVYRTRVWRSRILNDEGIRWLPFLLLALVRVVRKESPQVIYLTGGPFFPLIAGPIAKLLFGLPYIVDLRDPWRSRWRGGRFRGFKARLGHWLTRVSEPIVIHHAARVICVSEHMREEYEKAYEAVPREEFVVITNGFDPDDFAPVEPILLSKFTIVYTGKFRTSEALRDPAPFFRALKILRERGCEVHFVHIGSKEQEVLDLAEEIGIDELAEFIGSRPYNETLAYAKGADLLLLVGGGQKTEQTGKVFDYIGCQRPILALAPRDGEIARVTKEIQGAKLLDDKDPAAIAGVIEEIYRAPSKIRLSQDIEKYHRRKLTGILGDVLSDVLTKDNKERTSSKQSGQSSPRSDDGR